MKISEKLLVLDGTFEELWSESLESHTSTWDFDCSHMLGQVLAACLS